jgi:hypothetical protein
MPAFPFCCKLRWNIVFISRYHVNRLRRAGVPREAVMRLVNHSSDLIHQTYQREKVEDVVQWRDAVQFPA